MGGGDGEDDPGVHALAVDSSGNVYVGGGFTTAGDVPAENVAKWDSTAWSALGTGIGGTTKWPRVSAVAAGGSGSVYAGGNFTTAGGVELHSQMGRGDVVRPRNGDGRRCLGTYG